MVFELYGMFVGNVSMVIGDNMKLVYGGKVEFFLMLVVIFIYDVIFRVSIYEVICSF